MKEKDESKPIDLKLIEYLKTMPFNEIKDYQFGFCKGRYGTRRFLYFTLERGLKFSHMTFSIPTDFFTFMWNGKFDVTMSIDRKERVAYDLTVRFRDRLKLITNIRSIVKKFEKIQYNKRREKFFDMLDGR